jgi:ubiquitin C-terminal hydrolase
MIISLKRFKGRASN